MTVLAASKARANLYTLLNEVASSHEPVQIICKGISVILIAEEDWQAILETLHLLSIPGMRESVRKGIKTPVEKCLKELKW